MTRSSGQPLSRAAQALLEPDPNQPAYFGTTNEDGIRELHHNQPILGAQRIGPGVGIGIYNPAPVICRCAGTKDAVLDCLTRNDRTTATVDCATGRVAELLFQIESRK